MTSGRLGLYDNAIATLADESRARLHETAQKVLDEMPALTEETIDRLATLDPIEYDRVRQDEARRLGVRVATLDLKVAARRPKAERSIGEPGQSILLSDPEPWDAAVDDLGHLIDIVLHAIRKYVIVTDTASVAIALWILHTHVHDAFSVSPLLAIQSPEKRCGKSTLLELLMLMVARPISASNLTTAVVFRLIDAYRPTLLIDEADTFLRSDSHELRGIIDSGHRRSMAQVPRAVGENHEVRLFPTWAPKAIAGIGRLPDTIEDRSIVIAMSRRAAEEAVARLRFDQVSGELEPVRRMAVRWALDNCAVLATSDPDVPVGLDDRAADNWRPLLAVADAAGGHWPSLARNAAVELCGHRAGSEESAQTMLLADLRSIFEDVQTDRIASQDLVESLGRMEDRPWPEWRNGKPLTTRQLARLLKPFGIGPRTIRIGSDTPKGYDLDQFDDAFSRYLPSRSATTPQTNEDGAPGDSGSATDHSPVADTKSRNSQGMRLVADVADGEGKMVTEKRI